MTAHIIIHPNTGLPQLILLKQNIKYKLEHLHIHHATLEFETEDENYTNTNTI
jgi:hypothetical protein